MAQRIYQDYQREDRYYGSEGKCQRDKISKMAEIQNYVAILIDNNRNYGDELNQLRRENTDLRGQSEIMMGEMLKLKQNYEEIMAQSKSQYSKEVGGLIDELKDILNKKEQMEDSYKALLEELSYQGEYDKKARAQHLEELERNYENKIKILNDRIQEQNKELQSNYYINSDSKIRMVKEIDTLKFEVSELRKENNDLQQGTHFQSDEIARLSMTVKLLNKEKEQMGVNLLKIEQEKNHFIIELKQSGGIIRDELDSQIDNLKKMEVALIAKEKELQNLLEKYQNCCRERTEYEQIYHKLSNELNESQSQLANLKGEYNRLSDYSTKQIKRMSELIKNLETDKNKLLKEKQELTVQQHIKQDEIYTLLERMTSLEADFQQINDNFAKLQQESILTKKNQIMLRDEVESVLLELQNEREKCMLQMNHIQTLEQMVQKQKRKSAYLDCSIDREAVSKQLSNEQCKKYEHEMEQVIRNGNIERKELIQRFDQEKDRLIRVYEKLLREKETSFMEKITLMESQIRQIGGFK